MGKKSKQYYSLLIGKKAQLPSAASRVQKEFNFSLAQLKQLFILPHKVTLEPYVRAFQYNSISNFLSHAIVSIFYCILVLEGPLVCYFYIILVVPSLNKAFTYLLIYKVLNSILYTNSKLHKIGYSQHDLCTFCKSHPEKLNHFLYSCPCSKAFWGDFELFWFSDTQKAIPVFPIKP